MGVFKEIQRFIADHRGCGKVTGSVNVPTTEGYAVSVRCTCGEGMSRWVSPSAARHDLIFSTLLCNPN